MGSICRRIIYLVVVISFDPIQINYWSQKALVRFLIHYRISNLTLTSNEYATVLLVLAWLLARLTRLFNHYDRCIGWAQKLSLHMSRASETLVVQRVLPFTSQFNTATTAWRATFLPHSRSTTFQQVSSSIGSGIYCNAKQPHFNFQLISYTADRSQYL